MKLILGDSVDKLKELDDNSVDHIITDWPFFGVVKEDWDNQWKDLDEYLEWAKKSNCRIQKSNKREWKSSNLYWKTIQSSYFSNT